MTDRLSLTADTVAAIVGRQFPDLAGLPVKPILPAGWDNLSFRLGEALVVRMPSAQRYVAQVEKEQRWLPVLAPHLPLPIPTPYLRGAPDADFPFPFSVLHWIAGEPGTVRWPQDQLRLAEDLATFLCALQAIDARDGPPAGSHNFHRGGSLAVYDAETRAAISALGPLIDADRCMAIWETALSTHWPHPSVWVHGDIAPGNLLFRDGRLAAVIDFGSSGTGDPACDYAIAFTHFDERSRARLRDKLGLDPDALLRGQAWALWKALITLRDDPADPQKLAMVRKIATPQ